MLQDLFSSGAIKSATDFQVYKEVGGLSGLDFAFTDNTAVYHTKVIVTSSKLRGWYLDTLGCMLKLLFEVCVLSIKPWLVVEQSLNSPRLLCCSDRWSRV